MARSRVSKSCLKTELCFHRYAHFACVLIYVFGIYQKRCASDKKEFTFVKFTNHRFSSADGSLKDETRLLLLWVGSLVILHTFVFTHLASVVKLMHTFMVRSRASKSYLKAELCLHRYVHFVCVPIHVFSFHHKQRASNMKDFAFVKFTIQV